MSNKDNVRIEIKKSIKVDPLIANAIKILNEKGYTTKFCCSGHPDELYKYENNLYHLGSYVTFESSVFSIITETKNIPNNWLCNEIGLYRFFKEDDVVTFKPEQLIEISMKELEEWANELPELIISFMYDTNIECNIFKDDSKPSTDIDKDDNKPLIVDMYHGTLKNKKINGIKKIKWNKDGVMCKTVFRYLLKEIEKSYYQIISSEDYDEFHSKYFYRLFDYLNERATKLNIVNPSELIRIVSDVDSILFDYNNIVYLISRFDCEKSFITLTLYSNEYNETMLNHKDKILVY